MELFSFHALKKSTPTASTLSKLFRFVEFFLAMVLFSSIFIRLPSAFKTSGHFFHQFAGVIASPLFVFLLCNAIIVTLFVKSEKLSGEVPTADNVLYQELLINHKYTSSELFLPEVCSAPEDATSGEIEIAIEFQDKEVISQPDSVEEAGDSVVMEIKSDSESESESDDLRVLRRWKSEKVERDAKETEKFPNGGVLFSGDELSEEEFRRVVDNFIAEHLRFRRQESDQSRWLGSDHRVERVHSVIID